MPDITMCTGIGCPIRKECYRFTAMPSLYLQSYFSVVPYNFKTESCIEFWKTERRNESND